MRRRLLIGLTLLTLSSHGAAPSAPAPGDALDADLADETRPAAPPAAAPVAIQPAPTAPVAASSSVPTRATSANPLWGVPLIQLSGTRDRPIFSPSRRPPPVAAVAEPVIVRPARKKEIEPPRLSLVGTIASSDESFGIFIDQSTRMALRLKVGDEHQGWKLTIIQGREVTMAKDGRSAVLSLPQPGGQDGEVRLLPVSAVTRR